MTLFKWEPSPSYVTFTPHEKHPASISIPCLAAWLAWWWWIFWITKLLSHLSKRSPFHGQAEVVKDQSQRSCPSQAAYEIAVNEWCGCSIKIQLKKTNQNQIYCSRNCAGWRRVQRKLLNLAKQTKCLRSIAPALKAFSNTKNRSKIENKPWKVA